MAERSQKTGRHRKKCLPVGVVLALYLFDNLKNIFLIGKKGTSPNPETGKKGTSPNPETGKKERPQIPKREKRNVLKSRGTSQISVYLYFSV